MNLRPDPDDALFQALAGLDDDLSPAADRVHAVMWERTAGVQRGRRWRRRGGQVVLAGVLFAIGFLTARQVEPSAASMDPGLIATEHDSNNPESPPPRESDPRETPSVPNENTNRDSTPDAPAATDATPPWQHDLVAVNTRTDNPARLERLAMTGAIQLRGARLRRAGDLYLNQGSDVSAALRCYRALLKLMPENDRRAVAPDDTWLLVALKQDQRTRS